MSKKWAPGRDEKRQLERQRRELEQLKQPLTGRKARRAAAAIKRREGGTP